MVRVNSAEERNPTHQEFPRTLSVVMRIVLCGEDLVGNRCAQLCPRLLSCCQTETVLPSASAVPPHLSTSQTLTSSPVALMMKPLRTISGNLKDVWLTVICSQLPLLVLKIFFFSTKYLEDWTLASFQLLIPMPKNLVAVDIAIITKSVRRLGCLCESVDCDFIYITGACPQLRLCLDLETFSQPVERTDLTTLGKDVSYDAGGFHMPKSCCKRLNVLKGLWSELFRAER